jgi:hypothetical protein
LPEPPTFPGLTLAEQQLVEGYLRVADLLGRINPGREPGRIPTKYYRNPAQALVAAARDLAATVEAMIERGEGEIYGPTLTRAMLLMDAEARTGRVRVTPPDGDG